MTTNIILKKSSVVGKVPTAEDLKYGELALNYADGRLYYKASNNAILNFFTTSTTSTLYVNNSTLSASTTTGALVVAGGVGIGRDLYVGGTIYGNVSGVATQVNTVNRTSTSTHFLTFVDSNNTSSAGELVYTTSSLAVIPSSGNVGIGTSSPGSLLHVAGTMRFASNTSGSNYLQFERNTTNSWKLTSDGVGDVMSVVGNLVTFPQDVQITRGGLTVSPTLNPSITALNINHTWNSTSSVFRSVVVNATDTASSSTSLLMDLQVGGTSQFSIRKDGVFSTVSGIVIGAYSSFGAAAGNWWGSSGLNVGSTAYITWNTDVFLRRDAANVLAQRNGTSAQALRIYNTFTDASNYERFDITWLESTNAIILRSSAAGTGSLRPLYIRGNNLYLGGTVNTNHWLIGTAGHLVAVSDNSYDIGYSSSGRPRHVYAGTNLWAGNALVLPGTGQILFTGSAQIDGRSDGVIRISNASQTDFSRLQFGGTTSSFPALKRTSSTLSVRLADDSGPAAFNASNIAIVSNSGFLEFGSSSDVILARDASDTLSQRRSTNAQTFNLYNTYTDSSNYERGFLKWNSNVLEFGTDAAGTGTGRNLLLKGGGNLASQGNIQLSTGLVSIGYRALALGHTSKTILYSPSEGILRLSNDLQNDFNRLQFGGTTSSYPSLKRNTTVLEVKLADDSAFTSIKAKEVNVENSNQTSEATTLATTTQTQIASFPSASFRSGKLIVQAYDSVTGEVQISELLVAHNGTTASATEYGVVHTGASSIVTYDVDISGGNVRLLAQRSTANSTQYKINETLIVA